MSGFAVRKATIVDSTARSRGASSRKYSCEGEVDGEEGTEDPEDGTEGSCGGVVVDAEGVTTEDEGRARLFLRRWYRDNSPRIRFDIFAIVSSTSQSCPSITRSRCTNSPNNNGQTYFLK